MKKILTIMLAALTVAAVGCKKDDKQQTVDTRELTELISTCQSVLAGATSADYPQEAIDEVRKTVDAAAAVTQPPKQQVTNLIAQLKAALETFEGKAYGAIPADAVTFALSFDEGTGTSLKTSGKNQWTATFVQGPSEIFTSTSVPAFVDGKVGKALHFENGGHLEIADYTASAVEGNALSIAVWAKPDVTYANNYIISYNYWNSGKFQVQDGGKPFATINVNGCIDMDNENDNSVPAGAWTHIIFTYSSEGVARFYINGSLTKEWTKDTKGGLEGPIKAYDTRLPICIGACTTIEEAKTWSWFSTEVNSWGFFQGLLDELRVYNIALTDGQVSKLYNDQN